MLVCLARSPGRFQHTPYTSALHSPMTDAVTDLAALSSADLRCTTANVHIRPPALPAKSEVAYNYAVN